MNERLVITIPASIALWFAILAVISLALHREVIRPMTGRDAITVRLFSVPSKPQPVKPLPKPLVPNPAATSKPIAEENKTPPPEPTPEKQEATEAKSDSHGAIIISQTIPKIPDDLRKEVYSSSAVARFHVAADGSTTVELLTPSQNPRLNRFLLEALKTWRFAPATDNGNPVASTFDIRVHFAVE